jgi:hypothetical protein
VTECYSAFKQPLLDVFGKITVDDRGTQDAGKPIIIPFVQDGGRFHLGNKIYCPVPARRIRRKRPFKPKAKSGELARIGPPRWAKRLSSIKRRAAQLADAFVDEGAHLV